jgi:hypothetical protein
MSQLDPEGDRIYGPKKPRGPYGELVMGAAEEATERIIVSQQALEQSYRTAYEAAKTYGYQSAEVSKIFSQYENDAEAAQNTFVALCVNAGIPAMISMSEKE